MNPQAITFNDGEAGVTLGANYRYFKAPTGFTIVAASASPSVDDAGLTVDVNVNGSAVVTGIDASTKATPGMWKSAHFGGSDAPVYVAPGSVLSLTASGAAADTRLHVAIWYLDGAATQ